MARRTAICLLLVVVTGLILTAAAAQAYEVRLSGFPGITQSDCGRYCGAASCLMCCKWISSVNPSQTEVYNYCHANNMESWSIDPQGESWGLWNWTPGSPAHLYSHWHYTSKTGAIRGICLTIDQYKEAILVVIRSAAHWVVVRGFSSSRTILGNYYYNGTLVYGVYVNDPLYQSCGGYVGPWDSYFTADNWATNYFNNIPSGSHWANTRATAERDTVQNACQWNRDSFSYY